MAVAQVLCPQCGAVLKSAETLAAGTKVQCRKCRNKFFLPASPATPAVVAGPPAVAPVAVSKQTPPPPTVDPLQQIALPAPTPTGVRPLLLLGVITAGLLFVGSGIALTIICLQDDSPADPGTEATNNENSLVVHTPRKKPPPPARKKSTQNPPRVKKAPVVENPDIGKLPPDKQPPKGQKPPDSGKQPKAKPGEEDEPDPKPVYTAAQLRGSVRLGNDLVTVAKPRPLGKVVKKGLTWLAARQQKDGGWGEGVFNFNMPFIRPGGFGPRPSTRRKKTKVKEKSNVADTCIATLALVRSGSTPKKGPYAKRINRAVNYVLKHVEKADETSLKLQNFDQTMPLKGIKGFKVRPPVMNMGFLQTPLVHRKIGTHVDTFLATLLLSEVRGHMPDPKAEKRLDAALTKLIGKLTKNQGDNGSWAEAGVSWAPVLGQSLAAKAINRARQAGAKVPDAVLDKVKKFAEANFNAQNGTFNLNAAAGVLLYSLSGHFAAMQDTVNTFKVLEQKVRKLAKKSMSTAEAESKLTSYEQAKTTKKKATKVVLSNVADPRFLTGFGTNGGEEFLSFMNISEALAVTGGKQWQSWDKLVRSTLTRIQNKEGSWSGFHCITGKTFCTAAALLTLMADRAPVHVTAKVMQ
jgi:hypothetical protein